MIASVPLVQAADGKRADAVPSTVCQSTSLSIRWQALSSDAVTVGEPRAYLFQAAGRLDAYA
jgi:hypothetical protein